MSAPTTWIPLAERKPTAQDADDFGGIYCLSKQGSVARSQYHYAEVLATQSYTHWCSIPKSPPPPIPVDRDELYWQAVEKSGMANEFTPRTLVVRAHKDGRAAERKLFAEEIRAIFDPVGSLIEIADVLQDKGKPVAARGIRSLYKLMTEAAK